MAGDALTVNRYAINWSDGLQGHQTLWIDSLDNFRVETLITLLNIPSFTHFVFAMDPNWDEFCGNTPAARERINKALASRGVIQVKNDLAKHRAAFEAFPPVDKAGALARYGVYTKTVV